VTIAKIISFIITAKRAMSTYALNATKIFIKEETELSMNE
jgi:hypothetical protein